MDEEYLLRTFTFTDGVLINKLTGMPVGTKDVRGKTTYLSVNIKRKRKYVHRILFWFYHGYWPKLIDHDDGDGLNNKKNNLVDRNHNQNLVKASLRTDNTSGYKGVRWHKAAKKWTASLGYQGVDYYLGLFDRIDDAIFARKLAEDTIVWNHNNTKFEEL